MLEDVKALPINVKLSDTLLLSEEYKLYEDKQIKIEKALDTGIEIQAFVIKQNPRLWKELVKYFTADNTLTQMRLDILSKFSDGRLQLPSEKQAKIIYELHNRAFKEGFVLSPQ